MSRVYLVDDEAFTIKGITAFINNNFSSMEIVGSAGDGVTAFEEIQDLKPDIVITDVRMPGLNGVELSKKLRAAIPELKMIFISGYDDVDYIRNALKVEAIDYILKPVNIAELKQVLSNVEEKISKEYAKKKYSIEMEQKLLQSMPALRQRFFYMIINRYKRGNLPGEFNKTTICNRMKFLDIDLPYEGTFITVALWIKNVEHIYEPGNEMEMEMFSFAILNVMQEIIDKYARGYVFETEYNEFGAILLFEDEYEDLLLRIADKLHKTMLDVFGLDTVLGIGDEAKDISEISRSWKAANNSVRAKSYLGANHTIYIAPRAKNTDLEAVSEIFENLEECLRHGNSDAAEEYLEQMFQHNGSYSIEYYKTLSIQLLLLGGQTLLEKNSSFDTGNREMLKAMQNVFAASSSKQLKSIVEACYRRLYSDTASGDYNELSNVVSMIKNIIDSQYNEKLTLSDIAREVFLTPTYVCLVFKEDTGLTVNEYITSVRMAKARELLRTTDMKFADIAEKIGYSDASYFSKLFKRYEGMLPSEYRQRNRK